MNKNIFIVSPIRHSASASISSVADRAAEFARIISQTDAVKITLVSITDFINNGIQDGSKTILIDFRIGDILEFADRINNIQGCILLLHKQDESIYTTEDYLRLKNIFLDNQTNVATASGYGRDFLIKKEIPINSGIIRIPIRKYSDGINSKALINNITSLVRPKLVVWLSPAVRKNSYYGLVSALDAAITYNEPIDVVVVSRFYETKTNDLLSYMGVTDTQNVNIVEHIDPSNEELDFILSGATTVYLPSYDEGFNLPMYESARLGCEVVVTSIPVHNEAQRIYNNISTISSYDDFTIIGNDSDEISDVMTLQYPSYNDTIGILVSTFSNWKNIVNRMKKVYMKNIHRVQPWRNNLEVYSRFAGTNKRRTSGRSVVTII